MNVGEIYDGLDDLIPFSSQEDWDNSGLLIGDRNCLADTVVTALDPTAEIAEFAANRGAQLVITHHPVIFRPLRSLSPSDPVYSFVKYGISLISTHTCFDRFEYGVSRILAETIGIKDFCSAADGFVYIGEVSQIDPSGFADLLSARLGGTVRYCDAGDPIKRVAVCGGSGADVLKACYDRVDAAVTGEASHHDFIDALAQGMSLFACGHFETENTAIDRLTKMLEDRFPSVRFIRAPQSSPCKTHLPD